MQRIGRVLNVTPSKNIIIKLDKAPKIGAAVIDENLQVIGKVFDIIGPVTGAYALVKPSIRDVTAVTGKQLYVSTPSRKGS